MWNVSCMMTWRMCQHFALTHHVPQRPWRSLGPGRLTMLMPLFLAHRQMSHNHPHVVWALWWFPRADGKSRSTTKFVFQLLVSQLLTSQLPVVQSVVAVLASPAPDSKFKQLRGWYTTMIIIWNHMLNHIISLGMSSDNDTYSIFIAYVWDRSPVYIWYVWWGCPIYRT
jgi:hypothetical protein